MNFIIGVATVIFIFVIFQLTFHFTMFFGNEVRAHPRLRPSRSSHDVCNNFEFNAVEWMLYWKGSSHYGDFTEPESKRCISLYQNITKERGAKWIYYKNGKKVNLGCSKDTVKCIKDHAHWDVKRNIRIENPPCCREKIIRVLQIVTSELTRLKIPHVVIGGVALGWMRNNQFVPYDQDSDVWVNGKYFDTPAWNKMIANWSATYGLYTEYRDSRGKQWVLYSKKNWRGLDIFPWFRKAEYPGMLRYHPVFGSQYQMPEKIILPPQLVSFTGVERFIGQPTLEMYLPRDPLKYVEEQYGKSWRTEKICTTYYGEKCTT